MTSQQTDHDGISAEMEPMSESPVPAQHFQGKEQQTHKREIARG